MSEQAFGGSASGVGSASGTLSAEWAADGTIAGVASQTGAIAGAGALAGSIAGVASQDGSISGAGAIAGTAAGVATQTGTLDAGGGIIEGTSAGVASQTGAVAGSGSLAGALAGVATQTGGITGAGALSGALAGVATQTGAVAGAGAVGAAGTGVASQTGFGRPLDAVSLRLDDADEYATSADNDHWSCDTEDLMTIQAHVYLDATNDDAINPIVTKVGGDALEYALFTLNDGSGPRDLCVDLGSYRACTVNTALSVGAWHLVEFRFDGAGAGETDIIQLWIDNVNTAWTDNGAAPTTLANSTSVFDLGRTSQYNQFLDGWIDNVIVACDAISQTERDCLNDNTVSADPRPMIATSCGVSELRAWLQIGDNDTHPTLTNQANGSFNLTCTNTESGDFEAVFPP